MDRHFGNVGKRADWLLNRLQWRFRLRLPIHLCFVCTSFIDCSTLLSVCYGCKAFIPLNAGCQIALWLSPSINLVNWADILCFHFVNDVWAVVFISRSYRTVHILFLFAHIIKSKLPRLSEFLQVAIEIPIVDASLQIVHIDRRIVNDDSLSDARSRDGRHLWLLESCELSICLWPCRRQWMQFRGHDY